MDFLTEKQQSRLYLVLPLTLWTGTVGMSDAAARPSWAGVLFPLSVTPPMLGLLLRSL